MAGKGVEGVAEAVEVLVRRGVGRSTAAPPLFRLLWWLRVSVPPPHFMRPSRLFALAGVWFGAAWGGLMWLVAPGNFGIGTAVCAGVAFGVALTVYYRWSARRLELPRWEELESRRTQPAGERSS